MKGKKLCNKCLMDVSARGFKEHFKYCNGVYMKANETIKADTPQETEVKKAEVPKETAAKAEPQQAKISHVDLKSESDEAGKDIQKPEEDKNNSYVCGKCGIKFKDKLNFCSGCGCEFE